MKYKNYVLYFILFYIWVLVVNPQQRFSFLSDISHEKIIVFLCWAALFISGKYKLRFDISSLLIVVFYFWLFLSYLFSAYQHTGLAQDWMESYWKYIVLYFLILFSITNLKDLFKLMTGFVVILFLFQIHSWIDFINGGSYVYQQGIKRIVGIWTVGVGAANYYGMITMLSLPFAYFWYRVNENKRIKYFLIFYFVLTFLSVAFSGTRGAIASVAFFILINMRGLKQIAISSIVLIITIAVTYYSLPDYLRFRYFGLITHEDFGYQIEESAEEISENSAQERLNGLTDGWKLAMINPILGCGPGGSPEARKLIDHTMIYSDEENLQLHNLYGQLFSETGFGGTVIFALIIVVFFMRLKVVKYYINKDPTLVHYKIALQNFILLMLFYGMASHTLYRYYWLVLFAFHGAFLDLLKSTDYEDAETAI